MNYFELYEVERKAFHVGARFIHNYDYNELEITHISDYNDITLKHLNTIPERICRNLSEIICKNYVYTPLT